MLKAKRSHLGILAFLVLTTISTPLPLNLWSSFSSTQVLAQTLGDRKAEADQLLQQGIQQYSISQFEAALQSWQQALIFYREIKDRLGEEQSLGNLGLAYQFLGDYAKAIDYQQQRLAISREIKDRQGEGASLGNLGLAYYSLGDYAKAIDYHQQGLAILREIKDRQGEGASLGNLGNAYYSLGDYAKAIDYQQQGLAILREIKDRQGEGASLGNLGLAYYRLGDYAKAIDYYQQLLAIAREIKDRHGEGVSLGNLGGAYDSLGDYAKAIDYQQQRLAISREIKDRQGEGASLGNLGLAYYRLGDYAKAIDYHQQGLAILREIKDRQGEGASLGNLGLAYYRLGDYAKAIDYYQQRLAIAREIKDRQGEGASLGNLGSAYNSLGDYAKAIDYQQQYLAIARSIKDLLGEGGSLNNLGDALFKSGNLAQAEKILRTGIETWESLRAKLGDKDAYKVSIFEEQAETYRLLQQVLIQQNQPNAALEIAERGRGGLGTIAKGDAVEQTKELQQLHQLLIAPIADLLPKDPNQRVVFVPQKSLFLVPFAALQDTSGKYLIEQHTILTSPAIQVLDQTRQQRQRVSGKDILVMGNPTMPKIGNPLEQLRPLLGAEEEAKAIAKLFNIQPILGKFATKAAFKQLIPKAKIIHLATHGLLDDYKKFGIPGAVALAPSGDDDGLLTSGEILDLKLNAELVVLSACDTGRGDIKGDGVIGLSRSLITAGTPSVLVSLWSVNDASTSSLMTEFYTQMQQKPDKAQALRQAMLKTKKEYPKPIYWAAFTLIGEAD